MSHCSSAGHRQISRPTSDQPQITRLAPTLTSAYDTRASGFLGATVLLDNSSTVVGFCTSRWTTSMAIPSMRILQNDIQWCSRRSEAQERLNALDASKGEEEMVAVCGHRYVGSPRVS
ncbi:hypothetical protein C8Q80DRAFT_1131913 [Daedaleopsis nitida]|nr:hypothetical protein C8Q80DRAFT_1131913 [Daedaleopsis nitida]